MSIPVTVESIKEFREKMLKFVDELAFNEVTARRYDKIRHEISGMAEDLLFSDTAKASEAKL